METQTSHGIAKSGPVAHKRVGGQVAGRWFVKSHPDGEGAPTDVARQPYPYVHVLDFAGLDPLALREAREHVLQSCAHGIAGDVDEVQAEGEGESIIAAVAEKARIPQLEDPQLRTIIGDGRPEGWNMLCSTGSGYHNDIGRWWDAALFSVLCLDARDVVFRVPQIAVEVPLLPGRMVIFDPALIHAVCHAADGGQFRESSFQPPQPLVQAYLTRTVRLLPEQWADLQCPWVRRDDASMQGRADLGPAACDWVAGRDI